MDESTRSARTILNTSLFTALVLLLFSCDSGEAGSPAIDVKSAEWRGGNVLVSGDWTKGLSTPPICRILEGRDGPASSYFEPDGRVVLDGDTFSREFIPVEAAQKPSSSSELNNHYVRCSVSLDSGKSEDSVLEIKSYS